MANASAKVFLEEYKDADKEDRLGIFEKAKSDLSGTQFKVFKKEVKSLENEEKERAEEEDSEDGLPTPPQTEGGSSVKDKKDKKDDEKKKVRIEVSESELEQFWTDLDSMSGEELLDEQVVKDFQYVGFDPNVILKSVISRGKAGSRDKKQIQSDISKMCIIAILKGSITDTNLKKMTDQGKRSYSELEGIYGLKRGGSKGVDPQVVTIARVGAAFPGPMMRIQMQRPDLAKKFSGPFGTKILPSYMRHQSAAACIPETLDETVKSFLLGLICAFTSDQSKVISKSKDKPQEIFGNQENFVAQTHGSNFPSEAVRKQIFKTWTIVADYDKLKTVGDTIAKVVDDFNVVPKEDVQKAFNKI